MQVAMAALLLLSPAVKDVTTVTWHGSEDGQRQSFKLTIERGGVPEAGYLALSFEETVGDEKWLTSARYSHTNNLWNEWKLAIPIKVSGVREPQVLAKRYRPSWIDFQIYHVDSDGIERAFTFSSRDEQAIRWNFSRGSLVTLETFDRFESRRDGVGERPGYRWQLHQWWRFDEAKAKWVSTKKRWDEYKFGSSAPGDAIEGPSDCRFLFPASSHG